MAAANRSATEPALALTRVFDAPRELVFKAWTESEHLNQWWGSKGSTVLTDKLDLRPGGLFHYRMVAPDGNEMLGKFIYSEIAPPERLVFVNSFSDAEGNTVRPPFATDWPLEMLSTLIFTEDGGRTTLSTHSVPLNATESERKAFEAGLEGMRQGFAGTYAQLDEYLAKVTNTTTSSLPRS